MDADADGDPHPMPLGELCVEGLHGRHHAKTRPHSPLGAVFMRLGIAKVDQQPIAEVLRNVPLQGLDHRGTRRLVGADDLAQVFGVELACQDCRVHQITEQHGELPALRFRG